MIDQPLPDKVLDTLLPAITKALKEMEVQWVQFENARLKFKYKDCFIELTIKQVKE